MAKAIHVGKPHSLQLVLASNLNICRPLNATVHTPLLNNEIMGYWILDKNQTQTKPDDSV
jgi:hypothetical protein